MVAWRLRGVPAGSGPPGHRRGAALVEFAVVLPVLLLLLLGLMELGWAFFKASQLTTAARAGVREAIRPDTTEVDVQAKLDEMMQTMGMGGVSYDFELEPGVSVEAGEPIEVSVVVAYDQLTLTGLRMIPMLETLRGHAAMAKEGP